MIQKKIKEKCGVVGVRTNTNNAPQLILQGLNALQHRGQESAGITIFSEKKKLITYKGQGLVSSVLSEKIIKKLGKSTTAIGHNRYGTSGSGSEKNAQPFMVTHKKHTLALGHNGNIPDVANIKKLIGAKKTIPSDSYLAALALVQERARYHSWDETFIHVLPVFRGAYNFVAITEDGTMYGIRDPFGIRPLCLGKLSDGWIIASESIAIDAVGGEYTRDVAPGEIIKITPDGNISSFFFGPSRRPQHCLFEYIYFARPDSFMHGKRVREGREKSGTFLAKRMLEKKITPDVIVPTFDSGYPAAKGVAATLKLPMVDAITTSHYYGRTFIQPGQDNRITAVRGKHNIVPDEIINKKVVVVDDSAVRMTTSKALIKTLKDAGAKEVYFAIASPPVVEKCNLGIDMRNKKFLPAAAFAKLPLDTIENNIADLITADKVIYLPIEKTTEAFGGPPNDFYYYPFGGPHPIKTKQELFPQRKQKQQSKAKICFFISSGGTNLQKIIDHIESDDINAEIINVIANRKDAYGLMRAKKHAIPHILLEYTKKHRDTKERHTYEKKLIDVIKKNPPDIILLSGWDMILSDTFLKEMQQMDIAVINHHPALLPKNDAQTVVTSRGIFPVLKGYGFKNSYAKHLPVAGISVHQILPGNNVDAGPVIMKAEVRIHKDDTLEEYEKKVRAMEYILLPSAIKRILHVVHTNNISIRNGDFPW